MARSKWAPRAFMEHILAGCMRPNREALRLSMDYGARIGDVLKMPRSAVEAGVYSFKEEKTGKRRRIKLSDFHRRECLSISGKVFVFEHRLDPYKHRTRQAVFKDLKRMAKAYRIDGISPHTARKIYSVERYKATGGNLEKVQKLLNHSDEAVTVLYAMADKICAAHSRTDDKK